MESYHSLLNVKHRLISRAIANIFLVASLSSLLLLLQPTTRMSYLLRNLSPFTRASTLSQSRAFESKSHTTEQSFTEPLQRTSPLQCLSDQLASLS